MAVRQDGRANPNQLLINGSNQDALDDLRRRLVSTHERYFGTSRDLLVGLQLTHSGRFSDPETRTGWSPKFCTIIRSWIPGFGIPADYPCLTDSEIEELTEDFIRAAARAWKIGFHFVDIKHCHGYLGHEFLNAKIRAGPYGGSFENRTRFLRNVVSGIRAVVPQLEIAVRLSAFDTVPFEENASGRGVPREEDSTFIFGRIAPPPGLAIPGSAEVPGSVSASDEIIAVLRLLKSLSVRLICLTGGSPYYNPHIQRPALFPPSDGYQPPEDPLVGVARHLQLTCLVKKAFPDLIVVGSGQQLPAGVAPPRCAQTTAGEGC